LAQLDIMGNPVPKETTSKKDLDSKCLTKELQRGMFFLEIKKV